MMTVRGQLIDQLREMKDLISSLLSDLKTSITFFSRHINNSISHSRAGGIPVNPNRGLIRLEWFAQAFEKNRGDRYQPLLVLNEELMAVNATLFLKSEFHS